jgi:hypothetical protein
MLPGWVGSAVRAHPAVPPLRVAVDLQPVDDLDVEDSGSRGQRRVQIIFDRKITSKTPGRFQTKGITKGVEPGDRPVDLHRVPVLRA